VRARDVFIRARVAVVSDAGFRNTFGCADGRHTSTTLLPEAVAAPQRALLQGVQPPDQPADKVAGSIAMVYMFVGLDASDDELGIRAQNVWQLSSLDAPAAFAKFNALELDASGGPPSLPSMGDLPAVFLGSASAKDSDWPRRHPGKAAMTVLAPVRAEWFDRWAESGKIKNRGAEYKAYKGQWRDLLLRALYHHWPSTEGHVVYTDIATPLSNDFYLNSRHGEVYGLDHPTERFETLEAAMALHPETSVPGLYMTGQDVMNVGIASALLSGLMTACRISTAAAIRLAFDMVTA